VAGHVDECEHANNKEFFAITNRWVASPFTFQKLLSGDLDAAPFGAARCLVHTSLLA
jgi:hypothetical protein